MNNTHIVKNSHAQKQVWNAQQYAQHGRFVADHAEQIMQWLNPKKGEKILDVGCGDGVLTKKISQKGAHVIGIDISENLIREAKKNGINAQNINLLDSTYNQDFDAVFSNAALHWITQPEKAARAIFNALKKKGRFVAEFGGHGNVAAIITAMRAVALQYGANPDLAGPWFFPTEEQYQNILEKTGFSVQKIELIPRRTHIKSGMEQWLMLFRKPFFNQFDAQREKMIKKTLELLKYALRDKEGNWYADYVRIRVEAYR